MPHLHRGLFARATAPLTRASLLRWQGFGTLLMEEAERIAREEHGSVKIAVISGEPFLANRAAAMPCELDERHLQVWAHAITIAG